MSSEPTNVQPADDGLEEILQKLLRCVKSIYTGSGFNGDKYEYGWSNEAIEILRQQMAEERKRVREEDCKAVCRRCREGVPLHNDVHVYPDTTRLCDAAAIRKLEVASE